MLAEALCPVYAAKLIGAHKCDAPSKNDDGRILKHAAGTDDFHRSSTKIEPERTQLPASSASFKPRSQAVW